MGMLVLNKRVEKLEEDSLSKSEGGVITGQVVLFNKPLIAQNAKINKETYDATLTDTYMAVYDNQARTQARCLTYSQFQLAFSSNNSKIIRNKVFLAVPGSTSSYAEVRDSVTQTGTATRSYGMSVQPLTDNTYNLGAAKYLWKEIFAAAGTINTSDERLKTSMATISDAAFEAWADVRWGCFRFLSAIEEKGEDNARLHCGVVAQQVLEAFRAHGLDATAYGIVCHDTWDDEYDDHEDGTRTLIRPAGDVWCIRYAEALAFEAAYQRWRADKLEARLTAIEARIADLEA